MIPALGVIDERVARVPAGAPRPLPAAPVLEVRGLTKRFPVRRSWRDILRAPLRTAERITVVDAVDLAVRPGEFFGLLGANGAGKTTLFRMLATHLLPDAGTATVAGHDVVRAPHEVRAQLASVVTDERSLRWRLTARQNLDLFAALHGLRGGAARTRVTEVLRIVDLMDDLRMVGGYSSGMKQRLLIARALLSQPRVLLLDEPTRSLDPVSARRFRAFLRDEIAIGQRCAVLLATHNADEAFDLCDRVAVLHHGRVLASGPALQLARATLDAHFSMLVHRDDLGSLRTLLDRMGREDLHVVGDEVGEPDWVGAELHVPGGAAAGAELLGTLVLHGVRIARMEAVRPTLADMIERIVQDGGGARV